MLEVFVGALAALIAHSLVQSFIIDPITMSIRVKRLEKAADAYISQANRVSRIGNTTINVANPNRVSPDRLQELFEQEMKDYTGKND